MLVRSGRSIVFCAIATLALCGGTSSVSHSGTISAFDYYVASSDFNAFILGDISDYSTQGDDQTDIEGAVAVAGNVQSTGDARPSLTVGYKLAQEPGYDGSQTNLIVGGSLDNVSNTVHGSVWVGGDATLGSGLTVDGNVTVGGNLNYNDMGSGGEIGKTLSQSGTPAQVLVGGDATLGNGSNVYGTVQSNGNITVNGDGMGDTSALIATGTVTHNNGGNEYLLAKATEGATAAVLPPSPIDFSGLDAGLKADSLAMASLTSNAIAQQDIGGHWGALLDTSTSSALPGQAIVFDLGLDDAYLWQNGFSITGSENVEVIINIGGGIHSITNFAFLIDPAISLTNIVFNFFEATEIYLGSLTSGIGFKGNIFAPLADVYFYNGLLEGNLVAHSLTGNGQINWMGKREGENVPAPAPFTLMLLGLFLLTVLAQRSRRIDANSHN